MKRTLISPQIYFVPCALLFCVPLLSCLILFLVGLTPLSLSAIFLLILASIFICIIYFNRALHGIFQLLSQLQKDDPNQISALDGYLALKTTFSDHDILEKTLSSMPLILMKLDMNGFVKKLYGGQQDFLKLYNKFGFLASSLKDVKDIKNQSIQALFPFYDGQKLCRFDSPDGLITLHSEPYEDGHLVALCIDPKSNVIINLESEPESVKQLSHDLFLMLTALQNNSQHLTYILTALSKGDFTVQCEGGEGVFKELGQQINLCIDQFTKTLFRMQGALNALSVDTDHVCDTAVDLSERAQRQSTALQQTAATMEQLSGTVKSSADNAIRASELAAGARKSAHAGGKTVSAAIEAMGRIEESSSRITQIVSLIDDVAFQTNLLALNAAVEAARAGEAGKGFAVVAAEVRTLAQRAGQASKEITNLIMSTQERVTEGVSLVRKTESELSGIVDSIGSLDQIMADIASAARQQATGISEVTSTVSHMDSVTSQTADMIEETANTLNQARSKVHDVLLWTSAFKLPQSAQDDVYTAQQGSAMRTIKALDSCRRSQNNEQLNAYRDTSTSLNDRALLAYQGAAVQLEPMSDIHEQQALLKDHFVSKSVSSEFSYPIQEEQENREAPKDETVAKFLKNQEEWHEF